MNAEQIQERKKFLLAQEWDNPAVLWWMSFCDLEKPEGQQFLGVAIVEAPGLIHAHQKAWSLGINPGGQVQSVQVDGIAKEFHDRLLSYAELEAAHLI